MTAFAPDPAADPLADLKTPRRPAKARPGKKAPVPEPAAPVTLPPLDGIDPDRAHSLLGTYPPYKPAPVPAHKPGCVTFWDPGLAITSLRLKFPALFVNADWAAKEPFGKHAVAEGWRQLRLIEPGKGYDQQINSLGLDEETAPARVVVAYLLLAHRSTGQWPDLPRVRCRDTLPSGRRVIVGSFPGFGVELTNAPDDWTTPGLAVVAVPQVPKPPSRHRR